MILSKASHLHHHTIASVAVGCSTRPTFSIFKIGIDLHTSRFQQDFRVQSQRSEIRDKVFPRSSSLES
eukprot:535529-Pleurochrysis_carterae.AAC.4